MNRDKKKQQPTQPLLTMTELEKLEQIVKIFVSFNDEERQRNGRYLASRFSKYFINS